MLVLMKCIKMRRFMAGLCAFIISLPRELLEHMPLCGWGEAEECHFNHTCKNSTLLERSMLLVHIFQFNSLYFHNMVSFQRKLSYEPGSWR